MAIKQCFTSVESSRKTSSPTQSSPSNWLRISFFFTLFLTLVPKTLFANFSDLNFGAGLMNQSIGKFQSSSDGSRSKFNHRLTLEAGLEYDLNADFFLAGDLGALWPGGTDDAFITKRVFYANFHTGLNINEEFSFRLGGGLTFTNISGEGGTVELQNGTGTTSFIIPDQSSTARNVTFNIAGLYHFDSEYSVKLETFVFNIINSRNRTFNYALTARYHFGDSLWND
jgi:hypothetical protein